MKINITEVDRVSDAKTFTVSSGALRATDPCYKIDTWCATTLGNVLNGTWKVQVGYHICQSDLDVMKRWLKNHEEQLAKLDLSIASQFCFGEHLKREIKRYEESIASYAGRVSYIHVAHESVSDLDIRTEEFEDFGTIGVDSGQAGFFDLKKFNEQAETYNNDGFNQDTLHGDFYRNVCELTSDKNDSFGTVDFGAVSESGYGDGGYGLYVRRNDAGMVISAVIAFIVEGEEEEGEYYDEDEGVDQ